MIMETIIVLMINLNFEQFSKKNILYTCQAVITFQRVRLTNLKMMMMTSMMITMQNRWSRILPMDGREL